MKDDIALQLSWYFEIRKQHSNIVRLPTLVLCSAGIVDIIAAIQETLKDLFIVNKRSERQNMDIGRTWMARDHKIAICFLNLWKYETFQYGIWWTSFEFQQVLYCYWLLITFLWYYFASQVFKLCYTKIYVLFWSIHLYRPA